MKIIVATLVETAAGRSQAWFDSLKPVEQRRYLKEHPGSKFGQKKAGPKPSVKAPAAPVSRIQSLMQAYDPESGKGGRPIARHVNSALQKKGTFDEFHKISKQVANLTKRINKAKAAGLDYSDLMEKRKVRNTKRIGMLQEALGKMPVAELRKAGTLAITYKPEPVVEEPAPKKTSVRQAVPKKTTPVSKTPTPVKSPKEATKTQVPEAKQEEVRSILSDIPTKNWWEHTFPGSDTLSAWATDLLSDDQKESFAKGYDFYSKPLVNYNSTRNAGYGEEAERQQRWSKGRAIKLRELADMLGVPYNEERSGSWIIVAREIFNYIKDPELKKSKQV